MNGYELINYKQNGINLQCVEGMRLIDNNSPYPLENLMRKKNGMIVIAIDSNKETYLIIHHPHITVDNMISFLLFMKIKDAINICYTDNPHLIWEK